MLALLIAAAIATGPPSAFTVNDDVAHRRFVLDFQNLSRVTVCLSPAMWPNVHGFIPQTSARIWVSIADQNFPLDTFVEDFGLDVAKVKPGATMRSYLSYDAFKIPAALAPQSKILHLRPAAAIC